MIFENEYEYDYGLTHSIAVPILSRPLGQEMGALLSDDDSFASLLLQKYPSGK